MRDQGLARIRLEQAAVVEREIAAVYKGEAPKDTGAFAESIEAHLEPTATGFDIWLDTSQGDLARWLREGTGIFGPTGQRIRPVDAKALHFFWQGQEWFLASVAGMRANDWEERAYHISYPLVVSAGRRIVRRVAAELAH